MQKEPCLVNAMFFPDESRVLISRNILFKSVAHEANSLHSIFSVIIPPDQLKMHSRNIFKLFTDIPILYNIVRC